MFLLGLRHEALPLAADASGATVYVGTTAAGLADWLGIGQRVIVQSTTGAVDAVVQSVASGTIDLDVAPGAVGDSGGLLMPAMAVYLESQQDFDRYKTVVEVWKIAARAAIFDFVPPRPSFDLFAVTGDAAMTGATVVSRIPGLFGDMTVNFANAGVTSLVETGPVTTVNFQNGVTTLADVGTLLNSSSNIKLIGTYNPAAILHSGDAFSQGLTGTSALGPMGTGATLTMYDGHPVWDRRLPNAGTITDPAHGQTELVDLGGVPVSIGHANDPIWGRALAFQGSGPADRQWLKLMLATVRGVQRFFWLPTWRDDLTFVSAVGSTITVRTDDGSDFTAWWPAQRDRLQLRHADETVEYAKVTARVDNGDGTQTLTLSGSVVDTAIAQVSWLEAVRFDSNTFDVTFKAAQIAMTSSAVAFTPSATELAEVEL